MAYRTAAGATMVEEVVRGSRFLASVRPLESLDEFTGWLDGLRGKHRDANHHCWAYRFGDEMRFSDDGEPGGTAGRPILEVVLKRDLDRIGIVVVRYFGGKLLGAGGLVRAYGGTAAKALDAAGESFIEDRVKLRMHVPYPFIDAVRRLLGDTRGASVAAEEYDSSGWNVLVDLPQAEAEELRRALVETTRGASAAEPA